MDRTPLVARRHQARASGGFESAFAATARIVIPARAAQLGRYEGLAVGQEGVMHIVLSFVCVADSVDDYRMRGMTARCIIAPEGAGR